MLIYSAIYVLVIGALNAIRGAGILNRPSCAIYMGISSKIIMALLGYDAVHAISVGFLVFAGFWSGAVMGWGAGFASFSGIKDPLPEIPLLDYVANKLQPEYNTTGKVRKWGTIWMSLRGILFMPMFPLIAWVTDGSPLFGFGCVVMGLTYASARYVPRKYAVRFSEFLFGMILGLLIILTIVYKN